VTVTTTQPPIFPPGQPTTPGAANPQGADRPPAEGAGDLFDYRLVRDVVGFVIRSTWRHRLLASVCAVSVLLAAASTLWLLPRRWQVQTRLLAQKNPVMWTLSNPGLPRPYDWDTPSRAARETVLRRDNLVALCRQTGFVDKYLASRAPAVVAWHWVRDLVGPPKTREMLLDDLVDTLHDRLWVEVASEGLVTITFEWSNRDIAYQMVQAALDNFLEVRHTQELAMVGETISIIELHASKLQRQIDEGVDTLRSKEALYRRTGTPLPRRVASPARPRPVDDDVARLKGLLIAKRRALSDLEEFRQRRAEELQAQLSKLQATYADQHPDVVSARQNLEALSGPSPQINALHDEVLALEKEIVRRGGQVGDQLRESVPLAITESELSFSLPSQEQEDPRLEYERGQLRLLLRQYTSLLERIQGARMELDTVKAAFKYRYTVITPPQLPKKPFRPNPLLVLVAGLIGGVSFGVFAAVLVDLRSGRILERWQIERGLGIPVLAEPKA
jgi:uncharacterized protein involved in exopolysaccharide biosynthesis